MNHEYCQFLLYIRCFELQNWMENLNENNKDSQLNSKTTYLNQKMEKKFMDFDDQPKGLVIVFPVYSSHAEAPLNTARLTHHLIFSAFSSLVSALASTRLDCSARIACNFSLASRNSESDLIAIICCIIDIFLFFYFKIIQRICK